MSEIWIQVSQFILALSLLIVLHELGHFVFARMFKTKVERFYLFFDFLFPFSNILPFSLWKKKKGDTTYGIGWFPLGGYVKIAGMVDESMDTEQMKKEPEPWEFRSKKPWQRLLIMMGGIIVNVLLAFVIYAMILFTWGEQKLPMSELHSGIQVADSLGYELGFEDGDKIVSINGKEIKYYNDLMAEMIYAETVVVDRNGTLETLVFPVNFIEKLIDRKGKMLFSLPLPPIVGEVLPESAAEEAGLQNEDKLVAINDIEVNNMQEFRSLLEERKSQEVNLAVMRNDELVNLTANVTDSGKLGFAFLIPQVDELGKLGLYTLETREFGFFESFPAGVNLGMEKLNFYVQQFKLIFNPETGAYKGVGGFDSIRKIYPQYWDWQHFWSVTAFLSLILAFMNFLPIPGLDGGYVLFILIEMISGRQVNEKVMEVATTIGLVFLLLLMLYANGMDVVRIFQR